MARKIDITDKLSFDSAPSLIIKGEQIEINADAPTVLKVMGLFAEEEDPGSKEIMELYNLLFPDKSKKKLEKMKMSFNDLITVAKEAMKLITEEEQQGEQ